MIKSINEAIDFRLKVGDHIFYDARDRIGNVIGKREGIVASICYTIEDAETGEFVFQFNASDDNGYHNVTPDEVGTRYNNLNKLYGDGSEE